MSEEEIELAELQRALLDDETLDALLCDVDALCEIESITFKSSVDAYAEVATTSVASIRPALERGACVQLRYAFRGERWIDTLLPGVSETLLVRTRAH